MTARHRVTHGAVTVQTAVTAGGARAWVDVPPGKLLPGDVPADEVQALLRQGRIESVNEPEPAPEPEPLGRPAKSASKADWKVFAVQEGTDEDEADAATRDELAAKYADGGDD